MLKLDKYALSIPALQFLPIICDGAGEVVRSLFYDNVRDFHGFAGMPTFQTC